MVCILPDREPITTGWSYLAMASATAFSFSRRSARSCARDDDMLQVEIMPIVAAAAAATAYGRLVWAKRLIVQTTRAGAIAKAGDR